MTPSRQDDVLHAREEVHRSLRLYATVGGILFLGTMATVAVATIPALDVGEHGFDKWDAMLGLAIASTKATLVAAIFMHLNHERRMIYGFMTLAAMHAIGCFVGTYIHYADMTHDKFFYRGSGAAASTAGSRPAPQRDASTVPPASPPSASINPNP